MAHLDHVKKTEPCQDTEAIHTGEDPTEATEVIPTGATEAITTGEDPEGVITTRGPATQGTTGTTMQSPPMPTAVPWGSDAHRATDVSLYTMQEWTRSAMLVPDTNKHVYSLLKVRTTGVIRAGKKELKASQKGWARIRPEFRVNRVGKNWTKEL